MAKKTRKKSNNLKNWLIGCAVIYALICLVPIVWYVWIALYAPEKLTIKTFEVGDITTASGDTKQFIEVNYFSNANQNGLEMLDIKFNYLLDENKSAFYSQGLQFVGKTETDSISWNYYADDSTKNEYSREGSWWTGYTIHNEIYGSYLTGDGVEIYNYASGDDYTTTGLSANPISNDSYFRIELDDTLYEMKFKGTDTGRVDLITSSKDYQWWGNHTTYNEWYVYHDVYYVARLLFEHVKSFTPGTQTVSIVEFGDLFDYYQYSDGAYTKMTDEQNIVKVTEKFLSYYSIKVNVSADGATVASDSLFNCIHGSQNFSLNGESISQDYYLGRSIIKLDVFDFNLVNVAESYYALKLSQDFNDYYSQYASTICLSIEIDLDIFTQKEIEFYGFTEDSGLSNYAIFECYTTQTVNGETVRTEVAYA